jgi:hypothetical protein
MTGTSVSDILRDAADAVKGLPEHLQSAAFSEAVRMLEAREAVPVREKKQSERRSRRTRIVRRESRGSEKRRTRSRAGGLSIDRDLNLRPSGKPSCGEFYVQKSPKGQDENNAVFVYYLERVLGLSDVNADQVYTCYKEVKAKVPSDLRNSLHVTAARKGWISTEDSQDLKVTTRGENLVEHDLPRQTEA